MAKNKYSDLIESICVEADKENNKQSIAHLRNKFSVRNYLRIAEEIASYLSKNAEVLDWGCGYGHMALFLEQLGYKVTPYDIRDISQSKKFLKTFNIKPYVHSDPVYLPFQNESFDAVLSCGALEHVPDKSKSLSELNRVLKQNGYLFIYMLPNAFSVAELRSKFIGRSSHPNKFTFKSTKKILEQNNFKVVAAKRGNILPKCLKSLPPRIQNSLRKFYENYEACLSLEKALLSIPPFNIFSGTIEVVARKEK